MLSLGSDRHLRHTRGSVPAYGPDVGTYIPAPLSFRTVGTESSPISLAAELLALPKINWNQTQLAGRQPITLRTADNVGEILRQVRDDVRPQAQYAYHM
jgi:hypothetical protein